MLAFPLMAAVCDPAQLQRLGLPTDWLSLQTHTNTHTLTINRPIAGPACSLHPSLLRGRNYRLLAKSPAVVPIAAMSHLWHAVSFISCHFSSLARSLYGRQSLSHYVNRKISMKAQGGARWVKWLKRVMGELWIMQVWNRLEAEFWLKVI